MATLTPEQTDFLKSHHIPLDKTFDASGLSSKDYKAQMKQNGTLVAYGVPPCPKGHTLKNKQANCLQCNPQAVSSIKRQAMSGDVYIAVSPSQFVTKISVTEDASDIANQLNQQNHAEINDWQTALIGHTNSFGQMENHLQQRLADRQIPKKLDPNGKTTKASGVFDIDIHDAIEVLNDHQFTLVTIDNNVIDDFHSRYSQHQLQRETEALKLAQLKASEEQARRDAELAEKQAKLDAQKQQQQAQKQQKLEKKRLRQQQNEEKKAALLQQKTAVNQNEILVKTPNKNIVPTQSNATKAPFQLGQKQRNILVLFGLVSLVVLALIIFALFKR